MMKKKLTVLFAGFFLFLAGSVPAQSLSFSKGINLTGHCGSGTHVIDTVPQGKLWKLNTINHEALYIDIAIPGASWMRITSDDYGYAFIQNSNSQANASTSPLWLTAGQVLRANCVNGNSTSFEYLISILEFSTTP